MKKINTALKHISKKKKKNLHKAMSYLRFHNMLTPSQYRKSVQRLEKRLGKVETPEYDFNSILRLPAGKYAESFTLPKSVRLGTE